MPAPICVKCGLTMRCHKNEQAVIVTADKAKRVPYEFYRTDVYRCTGCNARIATGFSKPIERWDEARFKAEIEIAGDDAVWAY